MCSEIRQLGLASLSLSNMRIENDIATVIVLLAPIALIYGWCVYVTNVRKEHSSWRSRFSLMSLGLVSLATVLWPLMMVLAPKADWTTYVGMAEQVRFVYSFVRLALGILSLGFVLCFFGKPRLIATIVVSCIGIALFWLFTTMP